MKNDYKKGYIKIGILLVIAIIYILVSKYFYRIVIVSGNSMSTTVSEDGICLVETGEFSFERWDIVLAKLTYQTAIKRVIGIPGDTVQIRDGAVYINGAQIEQYNFYTEYAGIATDEIVLQEDEYFLLGDNRPVSYDSREHGLFDRTDIVGVVRKIIWKGKE